MTSRRVVITGFGAVSPLGLTAAEMWQGLCEGRCGAGKITAFDPVGFPCKFAGQVPDFKIQDYLPKTFRKAVKLMSRDIQLAIIAANEALSSGGIVTRATDAEKVNFDPMRMAINLGAGLISCDLIELAPAVAASITDGKFDIRKWGTAGLELVTPLWLLKYLPNMLACHIGIIHDIQGPSNTITCAEAASHIAIAEAAQIIARGNSELALAGGCEAKINPIVLTRQCMLKRIFCGDGVDPSAACRPFDFDAQGGIFGEGGGVLLLESLENARARGAKIYAELVGSGQSSNISGDYQSLEPDGRGVSAAIEQALDCAGIKPEAIDLVIPHGTAVAADDLAEAEAIHNALGNTAGSVPVLPTKSMLTNTGAAAGALDTIAAATAICNGIIPAAKNCDKIAAGCNLNIVKQPVKKNINYALCCGYTYGSQTAALILKRFTE